MCSLALAHAPASARLCAARWRLGDLWLADARCADDRFADAWLGGACLADACSADARLTLGLAMFGFCLAMMCEQKRGDRSTAKRQNVEDSIRSAGKPKPGGQRKREKSRSQRD